MGKDRNTKIKKGKDVANQGVDQHSARVQEGEQASRASKKKDKPSASQALLQKQPVPPFPVNKAPSFKDSPLVILQRSSPRNKRDSLRNEDETSSQSSEEAVLEVDPPRGKGNKKIVEVKPDASPGKVGSPLGDLASKESTPEQKGTRTSEILDETIDILQDENDSKKDNYRGRC
jgi:hypothetical protein